ncbi:MAG: hypothetical protein QM703_28710 [Gemmatales bacterium]
MNEKDKPAYPIWVLFKTQYEDVFDYKEADNDGGRILLVFSSHDLASSFASKYAHDYRAITFDTKELQTDFFKRRATAGVNRIAINPSSLANLPEVQPIGLFTQ